MTNAQVRAQIILHAVAPDLRGLTATPDFHLRVVATAHADGFVVPFCVDELTSTQCSDALDAALASAATHFGDIDSAGDIAVAELGIDNFPGRTLAELCPSIIPGQCGERQPIKGEGSRVCNDWGA